MPTAYGLKARGLNFSRENFAFQNCRPRFTKCRPRFTNCRPRFTKCRPRFTNCRPRFSVRAAANRNAATPRHRRQTAKRPCGNAAPPAANRKAATPRRRATGGKPRSGHAATPRHRRQTAKRPRGHAAPPAASREAAAANREAATRQRRVSGGKAHPPAHPLKYFAQRQKSFYQWSFPSIIFRGCQHFIYRPPARVEGTTPAPSHFLQPSRSDTGPRRTLIFRILDSPKSFLFCILFSVPRVGNPTHTQATES